MASPWRETKGFSFHSICLQVKDIEESVMFYQEVFGSSSADRSDIQKVWLQFPADKHTPMFGQSSSLLELVQRKYVFVFSPYRGTEYDNNYHDTVKGGSFHHLCFSVPDIHKARQRLISLGVETMDINPPRTDILILYDPDRHPIQLLSQDLDKHEELAKVCREVVLYGAERAMQDIRQSDNPVTLEEAGALANGF